MLNVLTVYSPGRVCSQYTQLLTVLTTSILLTVLSLLTTLGLLTVLSLLTTHIPTEMSKAQKRTEKLRYLWCE